jgi:MerR family transcriptional regulator, copper efflux regulator
MKSSPRRGQSDIDWSIGEAAARFGLETHVLRHWEDVGLLAPARDAAGRRRYGRADVVRLATIIRSKAAGMSLEQIAVLLDSGAPDRHRVLQDHLADLDRRMAEMQHAKEMAEHAYACRAHDVATCPGFRKHVDDLVSGATTWSVHPHPVVT